VKNTIGVGTVVVNPPIVNSTGVAITINWPTGHLPELVVSDMRYALEFKKGSANIPVTTQARTIPQELEPGDWYIIAAAYYGTVIDDPFLAAVDDKPSVEVLAGKTTPVSFTMNADKFLTPYIDGAPIYITRSETDSQETLSINMKTSTAFTSIPGWTDSFSYQVYYREDWNGPRTPVGSSGSFSSGSPSFSWAVDPSVLGTGTFYYEADIINTYTYTPPFTQRSVTNTIDVARVEVTSGASYSVGDIGPGGGTVFYYDPVGFPGGPGGTTCHYLEAAPIDLPSTGWGADGITVGANGVIIGTGYDNTQIIVAALIAGSEGGLGRAAEVAATYTLSGGYTDWYLPSRDELGELYTSGVVTGLGPSIWISQEVDAGHAWCGGSAGPNPVDFWDTDSKSGSTLDLRPIRAF
jgi:hypothetical protein